VRQSGRQRVAIVHRNRPSFTTDICDSRTVEQARLSLKQPGNLRGGLEWYRAFPVDHENALAWKREPLTIPVLALGGEHSYGLHIVSMLQEFGPDVTGSVAGCSHWMPEERPTEVTEQLLRFLSE